MPDAVLNSVGACPADDWLATMLALPAEADASGFSAVLVGAGDWPQAANKTSPATAKKFFIAPLLNGNPFRFFIAKAIGREHCVI
jgi:hypothetical protein